MSNPPGVVLIQLREKEVPYSFHVRLLIAILLGAQMCTSFADVSAYIPLHDRYLTDRIEQLRVATQMPVMRRPYVVAEVRSHLNKVRSSMPGLYGEIDRYLRRYEQPLALTYGEVTLAHQKQNQPDQLLANAQGEQFSSDYRVAAELLIKPTSFLLLSAGASRRGAPAEIVASNAYLALGGENLQLEMGYRDHWLSPFDNGAMLFSNNAEPPLSIGISNPIAFENWWNLHYEIFVARQNRMPVYLGTELSMGNPVILGSQFSFSPLDGWTIALTRAMQFGGGEREVNGRALWLAFSNPQSDHGIPGEECHDAERLCEFGNQLAALSSRIDVGGETPFSIYFEYGGEDSEQISNHYLGNLSAAIGVYIPFMPDALLGADWSFRYEYQQWQDAWWVHSIYPQGYTNDGVVLGHWAANHRAVGDAVGATLHALTFGQQLGAHNRAEWRFNQVQNQNYGQQSYKTYHDIEWRYYDQLWQQDVQFSLIHGKDMMGEKFWRVAAQWTW